MIKKASKIKSCLQIWCLYFVLLRNIFHSSGIFCSQWGCSPESPREWQMVDLSPWGMWTEWREGQKCCPTVTKVFGVRGQESICSGLRGHCFAGRDLLLWCVLLSISACGWVDLYSEWADFWTKKIHYILAWDDTHPAAWHLFHRGKFRTKTLIGDYSTWSHSKVKFKSEKLQKHPKCFYSHLAIATVWLPVGRMGLLKTVIGLSYLCKHGSFSATLCDIRRML